MGGCSLYSLFPFISFFPFFPFLKSFSHELYFYSISWKKRKKRKKRKSGKIIVIKGGSFAIYILLFSSTISRLTHLIMLSNRFHIIFRLWPLWFDFWNRYHKWSRDRFASPTFVTIMLSKSSFFQIQKNTLRP